MAEIENTEYIIRLSDDKTYLIVDVRTDITAETTLKITRETSKIADKYGISCFLFDLRVVNNSWQIWENYQFAQELEKYGRKREDKVALVIESGNSSHYFIETVTVNQGFNTRLFSDYNSALEWFREK